jgi:hypothetical protein
VESQRGAELAAYGLPGEGDVLIYVRELINKRLRVDQGDFLLESYRQIARHVESLRKR